MEATVASTIALGFREVNRECTGVDSVHVAEGLEEVFLGIWEKTWGEDTVIIGRAAEILPFFNGDVCSGTLIEVCTEDENGFGEKLVEELALNDMREVLDKGFAVLKYETVINWGTLVSRLENLVVIGIWGAVEINAEKGAGKPAVWLMPDLVLTDEVDTGEVDVLKCQLWT